MSSAGVNPAYVRAKIREMEAAYREAWLAEGRGYEDAQKHPEKFDGLYAKRAQDGLETAEGS